jgi:hypothetical protein
MTVMFRDRNPAFPGAQWCVGRGGTCSTTDRLPLYLGGPVLMGRCLAKRQRSWLLAAMVVEAQPLLR